MPLKRLRLYLCLAVATVAASACASGGTPPASEGSSSARSDPNVITQDELAGPDMAAQSVYDVIRRLRPNFLASRGGQVYSPQGDPESGQVHVSIDGSSLLPVDELKRLHVSGVVEIQFLSPAQAMQRFGGRAKQGPVILVRTL